MTRNRPVIYIITPVAKPRMTQRDKWLSPPRRCVAKYYAFKDQVALQKVELPRSEAHVLFCIPMPKSWSKHRKEIMEGQPHEQKPDLDNLIKALGDSVYSDDSVIWDLRATKIWANRGCIKIREDKLLCLTKAK